MKLILEDWAALRRVFLCCLERKPKLSQPRCHSKMPAQRKFRLLGLNHRAWHENTFAYKFLTSNLLHVTHPHFTRQAPVSPRLHVSLQRLQVNTAPLTAHSAPEDLHLWRCERTIEAGMCLLEKAPGHCPAQRPPCSRISANSRAGQPLAEAWKPSGVAILQPSWVPASAPPPEQSIFS